MMATRLWAAVTMQTRPSDSFNVMGNTRVKNGPKLSRLSCVIDFHFEQIECQKMFCAL